jgi:acetolactate synthase-1/2/3 large subunit
MINRTVSDYVWDELSALGLEHVFFLPGGGCMYLVDSLAKNSKIKAIPLLHEQSVGIAAEAYAQYKNSIGVALVTTGPGGTNALTACAAAWTDSTPMIFISGQVKNEHSSNGTGLRQKGFQEIPIVEMVKSITKESRLVRNPQEAINAIRELSVLAMSGRPGPVWLDIPLDVQSSSVVLADFSKESAPTSNNTVIEKLLLSTIASEWKSAKRPIILAGNGIRHSGSIDALKQLAQSTRTPVMLTWKAIDFLDENDELNAGRPGATAQPWANISVQNSDFVLILGARMDMGQVAYRAESFARSAIVTLVDIDPAELNKFNHLKWRLIQADVGGFMSQLLQSGVQRNVNSYEWIREIENLKREFPLVSSQESNWTEGVSNYLFLDIISDLLAPSDVIVPGSSGACSELTMQSFKVKIGQRVLNSEGLGPMGFGIPAAIGAHLASGKKRTICIDGDGGFMMNIQELASIVGRKLNIKFFVLNNNGYESIRSTQKNLFSGRYLGIDAESGLFIPPISELASGFGIPYFKITSNKEIKETLEEILCLPGPSVTELIISEHSETKYRVRSFIDDSGKIQSYPMEDMSPNLSLEELTKLVKTQLLPESISRNREK